MASFSAGQTSYDVLSDPYSRTFYRLVAHNGAGESVPATLGPAPGRSPLLQAYFDWTAARFSPAEMADPNVSGAGADPDDDGLPNFHEFLAGSDPHNPDTDGDGVPDGQDGCPLDPDIQPPRLPSFGDRYTVIDLSERGLLEYDKPYAINDAEQISGRFNGQVNDNYLFHEFLWQAGTRTAVPANFYVGGHRPSSAGALAGHVDKEINDEFGTYTAARAALWYPQQDQPILLADPTPVDLGQNAFGDVPRKFDSHALAINDSGAVVGLS